MDSYSGGTHTRARASVPDRASEKCTETSARASERIEMTRGRAREPKHARHPLGPPMYREGRFQLALTRSHDAGARGAQSPRGVRNSLMPYLGARVMCDTSRTLWLGSTVNVYRRSRRVSVTSISRIAKRRPMHTLCRDDGQWSCARAPIHPLHAYACVCDPAYACVRAERRTGARRQKAEAGDYYRLPSRAPQSGPPQTRLAAQTSAAAETRRTASTTCGSWREYDRR
jgi:hypothetical protein